MADFDLKLTTPESDAGTLTGAEVLFGADSTASADPGTYLLSALKTFIRGDVADGPSGGSSTNNAVVRWDGTTGRLLQDSAVVIDDTGNVSGIVLLGATNLDLASYFETDYIAAPSSPSAGTLRVYATSSGSGASLKGALNIKDENGNVYTLDSSTGDVFGPGSATSGNLASFGDTTGKLVADSGIAAAPIAAYPDPTADDADSLGSSGTAWSDLFLADGGVINFNDGDVTLTHSANLLTIDSGGLLVQRGDSNSLLTLNQTTPATYNADLNFQDNGSTRWVASVRTTGTDDFWIYNSGRSSADFVIQDADGDIGIGTTSPGAKVDVVTSQNATTTIRNWNNSTGASAAAVLQLATGSANNYVELAAYENSGSPFTQLLSQVGATGGMIVATAGAHPLQFRTSYTERMRIDGSGNVGIGTNNPQTFVHVLNDAAADTYLRVANSNSTTGIDLGIASGSASAYLWQRDNAALSIGTNNTERVEVAADGTVTVKSNVLVVGDGTTDALHTVSGAAASYRYTRYATAGSARWDFGADNIAESGSDAGSDLFLNRFDDSGSYLGTVLNIARATGVTTFNSKVNLDGGARVQDGTESAGKIAVSSDANGTVTWVSPATVAPRSSAADLLRGEEGIAFDFKSRTAIINDYDDTLSDSGRPEDLLTVTRASAGTYVGRDRLIKTAAANELRYNHDPETGEPLGVLTEGSRTNICLQSEDLSTTWSTTNMTISTNSTTAPDGATTADTLTNVGTSDALCKQTIAVSTSTTYTASAWVKQGDAPYVNFGVLVSKTGPKANGVKFTFSGETLEDYLPDAGWEAPDDSGFEKYTDGWYRIWWTFSTSDATSVRFDLRQSTGTDAVYTYAWGAQLELGPSASSYIATTTSSATRSADSLSIATSAFPYDSGQGTLFADFARYDITTPGQGVVTIDAGFSTNRVVLTCGYGYPPQQRFDLSSGGSNEAQIIFDTDATVGTFFRLAGAYRTDDVVGAENGALDGSIDTSATMPSAATQMTIGIVGTASLFGNIKSVMYVSRRMTNTEIETLTS